VTARQGPRYYPVAAVATLLADLDAFYLYHRWCGALDSGVEAGRVWMTCDCGAQLPRTILTLRMRRGCETGRPLLDSEKRKEYRKQKEDHRDRRAQ